MSRSSGFRAITEHLINKAVDDGVINDNQAKSLRDEPTFNSFIVALSRMIITAGENPDEKIHEWTESNPKS